MASVQCVPVRLLARSNPPPKLWRGLVRLACPAVLPPCRAIFSFLVLAPLYLSACGPRSYTMRFSLSAPFAEVLSSVAALSLRPPGPCSRVRACPSYSFAARFMFFYVASGSPRCDSVTCGSPHAVSVIPSLAKGRRPRPSCRYSLCFLFMLRPPAGCPRPRCLEGFSVRPYTVCACCALGPTASLPLPLDSFECR